MSTVFGSGIIIIFIITTGGKWCYFWGLYQRWVSSLVVKLWGWQQSGGTGARRWRTSGRCRHAGWSRSGVSLRGTSTSVTLHLPQNSCPTIESVIVPPGRDVILFRLVMRFVLLRFPSVLLKYLSPHWKRVLLHPDDTLPLKNFFFLTSKGKRGMWNMYIFVNIYVLRIWIFSCLHQLCGRIFFLSGCYAFEMKPFSHTSAD